MKTLNNKPRLKKQEIEFSPFFGGYAKIYTLSDQANNIFYVGCTVSRLETRLSTHLTEAKSFSNEKKYNKRKCEHIRNLKYKITATIVDMKWVTGRSALHAMKKAEDLEQKWIDKYILLGYDLMNKQVGVIRKGVIEDPEFIGKSISVNTDTAIYKIESNVQSSEDSIH